MYIKRKLNKPSSAQSSRSVLNKELFILIILDYSTIYLAIVFTFSISHENSIVGSVIWSNKVARSKCLLRKVGVDKLQFWNGRFGNIVKFSSLSEVKWVKFQIVKVTGIKWKKFGLENHKGKLCQWVFSFRIEVKYVWLG